MYYIDFSEFKYGNCKLWLDATSVNASREESNRPSEELCNSCAARLSCSSCLEQLGCGWCYSQENPTIGTCMQGNFLSPTGKKKTIISPRIYTYSRYWIAVNSLVRAMEGSLNDFAHRYEVYRVYNKLGVGGYPDSSLVLGSTEQLIALTYFV
jgi:hypothetical protein